jgi:uncharacterized YigZ family protein
MIEEHQKKYRVPAEERSVEIVVSNSRFISTVAPASSVDEARIIISKIRHDYADATHHVPAFIIGGGVSVIEHCSDAGEPSGTAGRPVLSVLKGSQLGDIVTVVTRYFGGTKLGTGGLVRAYSNATKAGLDGLRIAEKITTYVSMVVIPYTYYERVRALVTSLGGNTLDEDFAADVTMTIRFTIESFGPFQEGLRELTNGSIQAEIIETQPDTIFPVGFFNF